MATPSQPYGVVLPIAHGPRGFFNQSYTVLDQIKSNLHMLLRTKKGERRMNPEFGSGLWSVLFENFNDDMEPIIQSTIRADIQRWMSYVNVDEIIIDLDNETNRDKNVLGVRVLFTVPSIGIIRPQELEVELNTANV